MTPGHGARSLTLVACAHTTPPFVVDAGAIRFVPDAFLVQRDSAGGVPANDSASNRRTLVAVASQHHRVAALRVTPDRLQARIGDTLVPSRIFRVSGLDALGALVPDVVCLFGPVRGGGGVVKPLSDGRWLAAKVGRAVVRVRTMQVAHAGVWTLRSCGGSRSRCVRDRQASNAGRC